MLEEGGDGTSFVHIQGNRPGHENQYPYDRPLERGMVIGMDCGAWYRMYTVDYPRFAVLGRATAEQRRVHEAVKYVNRQMADAIRPGLRCSELYWVGANAVKDVDVELDKIPQAAGVPDGPRPGDGRDRAAERRAPTTTPCWKWA